MALRLLSEVRNVTTVRGFVREMMEGGSTPKDVYEEMGRRAVADPRLADCVVRATALALALTGVRVDSHDRFAEEVREVTDSSAEQAELVRRLVTKSNWPIIAWWLGGDDIAREAELLRHLYPSEEELHSVVGDHGPVQDLLYGHDAELREQVMNTDPLDLPIEEGEVDGEEA